MYKLTTITLALGVSAIVMAHGKNESEENFERIHNGFSIFDNRNLMNETESQRSICFDAFRKCHEHQYNEKKFENNTVLRKKDSQGLIWLGWMEYLGKKIAGWWPNL